MPSGLYGRTAAFAIRYRWAVLAASLLLLGAGGFFLNRLQPSFFPNDLSYLFYVDVWLPEDAPLSATNRIAAQAERIIERVAQDYARQDGQGAGREGTRPVLQSISTFVGGGGPRFWFSVKPEQHQLNYAQLIVRVHDSRDTARLIAPLQHALAANVVGARVDVRQLETGKPVGIPLSLRLSGEDIAALRGLAEQFQDLLRAVPEAARVRDNWGAQGFSLVLDVKPDRANLAGITNRDVALSVAAAVSGVPITTLREGDKRIPVVARLRPQERARLTDLSSLYVYGAEGGEKVPLQQVADISYRMQEGRIYRRNQFRTIVVSAFPIPGVLPSQVFEAVEPRLAAFAQGLPPGYRLEIAGEQEEQVKGFKELAVVMAISVAAIFLALVVQFRHAVKPFIVFAAIPYGIVGALAALWVMGAPFGFMAFLGIASLIGVIVSHIIVLFDFIEERREQGSPLEEALLDAGTLRLRPVMITVGATVIALVPLALHGGPLWQPLCYAQIGGLTLATFGTLLLVPVLYAIFVRDLKLIRWESGAGEADDIKR
jgi:multidrug efflux pump subunit AcrB